MQGPAGVDSEWLPVLLSFVYPLLSPWLVALSVRRKGQDGQVVVSSSWMENPECLSGMKEERRHYFTVTILHTTVSTKRNSLTGGTHSFPGHTLHNCMCATQSAAYTRTLGHGVSAAYTRTLGHWVSAAYTRTLGHGVSAAYTRTLGHWVSAAYTRTLGHWVSAAYTRTLGHQVSAGKGSQ